MKKLLYILLILPALLSAQSPGFLGRKLMIKTNLVNGIHLGFNGVDLEYITGRQFSLGFSVQRFSYQLDEDGVTRKNGVIKPRNSYCELKELVTVKGGTTKGMIVSLVGRYYFNKVMGAPAGLYTSADIGYGRGTLSGYSATYTYEEKSDISCSYLEQVNFPLRAPVYYMESSFSMIYLEAPAVGYQHMLSGRFSLDFKAALQSQLCRIPDEILQCVDNNVFVKGNTFGWSRHSNVFSPAIYCKIGFLLF